MNGSTSTTAQSTKALRVVSMNIAELVPSKEAPEEWNMSLAEERLQRELLATNPDVIALQECPSKKWVEMFLSFKDYKPIPTTKPSHAGYVALWIRSDWMAQPVSLGILPAVAAQVELSDGRVLWVASMHLEPFEEGSQVRNDQLAVLLQHAKNSKASFAIFAGDTNMRDEEDRVAEEILLLGDVWKVAGSEPLNRFSWDTTEQLGQQNRFYGSKTRAYQRRYDRIYYYHHAAANDDDNRVTVPYFRLIANTPVGSSKFHFLSDHFGIAAEIKIEWS
jgi:endonuclease/exonuclease/phosphatase family metal-dependent hydrolase